MRPRSVVAGAPEEATKKIMEHMGNKLRSRVWWPSAGLVLAALAFSGCAFSPAAREARFLDAGKKALAKKDYPRAIIQFNNARRVKKDDAEPYYELGLAYLGLRDYRSAVAALKKSLELNPKHLQAQLKMAELLAATGEQKNVQDSEERVRKVLAVTPNDPDALNALAVAEWELGKKHNAELDLLRALSQAPQNLQASMNLARIKIAANDWAGAEEVLKKAGAASSNSASPVLALAELYKIMGKPEAAERQYQRAIGLDPKNGFALLSLGNLYLSTNRADLAEKAYRQVSTFPDRNYKPVHAMFLFQRGKHDEAVAEFEKLARQDPSDRAARTRLVEAYFAVNRVADAEKVLTEALKKNSKDLEALMQRSRVYLAAGKYAEAQKDVALVLRLQGNSAPAHYVMSRIDKARGEALSQRQELAEALHLNAYLLPVRLELVELLLGSNAGKTALQVMDEAPDSQKGLLPAVIHRNAALIAVGEIAEARKGIDQGLAAGKTRDLLLQDAELRLAQHDEAGARKSLEEVLAKQPEDPQALALMVRSYASKGQLPAALKAVKEYLAQRPKSARLHLLLGELQARGGDAAAARQSFVAAKALDPRLDQAEMQLARLDLWEGKLDEARKRLSGLLSGPEVVSARRLLTRVEERAGNPAGAIEQCRKILESDPNNLEALNDLAYLLADSAHRPDQALEFAQRAEELAPQSSAVADTLGWVLYRKGLYTVALQHLEYAATARDTTGLEKLHLAMAYFKTGDGKRGQQALEAALRMDPQLRTSTIFAELMADAKSKAR